MFNIVVIVPHPDDESALGAGLIQRALRKSADVKIVILTSGTHGRTLGLVTQSSLAAARSREAKLATGILGVKDSFCLGYDDFDPRREKKPNWPGVTKKMLSCIGAISSRTIIVGFPPNGINGHPDHVRGYKLAHALAEDKNASLLCVTTAGGGTPYPDKSSYMKAPLRQKLHLAPTHKVKLTSLEMEKKLWALSCYRTQALSVLDFIRGSEGNLAEENFALARTSGPQTRKFLVDVLGLLPQKA